MAGRIVSYIHSDSITANKGGSIVNVECSTDFAARTEEFIKFSDRVAKMAYASGLHGLVAWDDVVEVFADLEDQRSGLAKLLREKIEVKTIFVTQLGVGHKIPSGTLFNNDDF